MLIAADLVLAIDGHWATVIAGVALWNRLGASFTFYAGAGFFALALIALIRWP